MSGNTINVQGNYIDVHDNEVVNLNIDKATVSMSADRCEAEDAESKAEVLTSNADFMRILQRAEEQGFCKKEGWQYRWRVKADAAYFASVASHWFDLSNRHDHDGDKAISWIPFEALFAEKGLRLSYNDIKQCKTTLKHKAEIDKLFR